MAEESSLEAKVDQLSKQIQDQARFTRFVVTFLTAAVLAVQFYVLTELFTLLPDQIVTSYMSKLDQIVAQWHFIEANMSQIKATGDQAAEPAEK